MKIIIAAIIILMCMQVNANDGMFMSSGGNLMPVKETSIEMRKEVLFLKRTSDGFEVSVYFEFFNPGEARDETVGFVSPPSSEEANYFFDENGCGDEGKKITGHPYISGFMVMVNNQLLPYQVARFDSTGFQSEIIGNFGGCDYVYYFNVHFEKGLNIIRHHYTFKGSSGLEGYTFSYRLSTGKMWAKDAIGDFELIIESPDTYMQVPKRFSESGSTVQWEINGIGRLAEERFEGNGNVFLRSGFLRFRAQNFAPDYDLQLFIPSTHVLFYELDRLNDGALEIPGDLISVLYASSSMASGDYQAMLADYSDEFIQLIINYFYARKGLLIRKPESAAIFSKALWYLPDPALNATDIVFSESDKKLIDLLAAERARRKK